MTAPACHAGAPPETEVGRRRDLQMDVALLGRPNAGKSSLYNAVAGGDARVGNFPGITVDVLEAIAELPGGGKARFLDLPGVYSLGDQVDPDSDEGQARACLERLKEAGEGARPFVVAQVVDATQLALGLRLTREIAERRLPLVVLVTQRDVLEAQGGRLDVVRLGREIGAPVLMVSARDSDVRRKVLGALHDFAEAGFAASAPQPYEPAALAKQVLSFDTPQGGSPAAAPSRTERIDAVVLHPVLGPVIFVALMTALFAAVFLVADPASSALDAVIQRLSMVIVHAFGDNWATSLVCDGILGGAGTVLAFLPQIVILTIALELIDASGYLARGAFLVDRVLRLAGLGGKSFVPLLTAHACAVPAIAATRIIRDPRQRLRTLLVIPLMTCSARIPTYGLLIASFFGHRGPLFQGLVFVSLYSAGIMAGFFASLIIGRATERKGPRTLPLVLEMPAYRLPQARVVLAMATRSVKRFLVEVGTVIVIASIGLWVLLKIPAPGVHPSPGAPAMESSIAASVGRTLEPVTKPLGFDWRINVGLIGSFGARELMVSTLGVTYGMEQDKGGGDVRPLARRLAETKKADGTPAYTVATALALMAFFVLACQCMSTIAALRRETKGWRVPIFVLAYTYTAAYFVALVVYQVARLLV
ncbi:MAG TPA: ferrous iron transporter B [Polyangiaceae bacterium]|nr:ferrous iron transporter B [Polyangiaceae bacterium]